MALNSHKGRTIRYMGGGWLGFLLLANFFFYLREKTIFFLAINVRQFYFYDSSKNFFVVCFSYYVRYHLVFFLVNIFYSNFDNKLFFSAHIFNKLFFLPFVATNYFFLAPPPPDIKWCVPKKCIFMPRAYATGGFIIRGIL